MAESASVLIFLAVALAGAVALLAVRRALGSADVRPAPDPALRARCADARTGPETRIRVRVLVAPLAGLIFLAALGFLTPWAISAGVGGASAAVPLLLVVVPLAVGFVYAARRGAFSW